jgi:hypothetical protein
MEQLHFEGAATIRTTTLETITLSIIDIQYPVPLMFNVVFSYSYAECHCADCCFFCVVESFDEGPGAVASRSRNRVKLLLAR